LELAAKRGNSVRGLLNHPASALRAVLESPDGRKILLEIREACCDGSGSDGGDRLYRVMLQIIELERNFLAGSNPSLGLGSLTLNGGRITGTLHRGNSGDANDSRMCVKKFCPKICMGRGHRPSVQSGGGWGSKKNGAAVKALQAGITFADPG